MRKLLLALLFVALPAFGQSKTGGSAAVTSSTSGSASGGIVSRFWAPGPLIPYLPVQTVNVTLPNTSGYTALTATSAANLQTQINTAAAGCDNGGGSGATGYVISIAQAASYDVGAALSTNGEVLPVTTCTVSWIVIKTTGLSWTRGTRFDPSVSAGTAAKLISSLTNGSVFSVLANTPSSYYWFLGLDIECNGNTFCIGVQLGANPIDTPAQVPNNFVFDHVYVHGRVLSNTTHCFLATANSLAIVDSWVSDCHDTGSDAQALGLVGGGPTLLQNDFLEASGEDIITGGTNTGLAMQIYGLQVHDLTETNNWYYKPLQWFPAGNNGLTVPVYQGGTQWDVKNIHEYKGCERCLIQNFMMENNWASAQAGQDILLNNAPSSNGVFSQSYDVTVQYGKVIGGTGLVETSALDGQGLNFPASHNVADPGDRENRQLVRQIIADSLSKLWCSDFSAGGCAVPPGQPTMAASWGVAGMIWDHITVATTAFTDLLALAPASLTEAREKMVYITNNIFPTATYGIFTTSDGSYDIANTNIWLGGIQAPTITNNAIVGVWSALHPTGSCTTYPTSMSGNTCPTPMSGMAFTTWSNGFGGDYTLTPGSAYSSSGSNPCTLNADGTGGAADCGANIAAVNAAISGVDTVPTLWPDYRSGGGITLTPSSLTCNNSNTVAITPSAGSSGGNQFNQSGLDVLFAGATIAPGASSTSSITITPPTYSGAVANITSSNIGVAAANLAQYTATNTLHAGDIVTVTGTNNVNDSGHVLDVTNAFVHSASGSAFTVSIAHANIAAAPPTSGTATAVGQLPITVSNFGLPLTALLTCN